MKSNKFLQIRNPIKQCFFLRICIGTKKIYRSCISLQKSFLACRRKSRAIVIGRSSLLLSASCKNFNVAHCSENTCIKGINSKLGILAHHEKLQLQGKGHNSEGYILELCTFLTKTFKQNDGLCQTSFGTALLQCSCFSATDQYQTGLTASCLK